MLCRSRSRRNAAAVVMAVVSLVGLSTCTAFSAGRCMPLSSRKSCLLSPRTELTSSGLGMDDFEGASIGEELYTVEGEALAHEFYELVRIRELREKLEEADRREREAEAAAADSAHRWTIRARPNARGKSIAGQQKGATPSAGLFSGSGASVYSVPVQRAQRPAVAMEGAATSANVVQDYDYGLWGTGIAADPAIVVQALTVLAMLAIYVAVGMSGRTTDAFNSFQMEPMDFNQMAQKMELVVDSHLKEVKPSVYKYMRI